MSFHHISVGKNYNDLQQVKNILDSSEYSLVLAHAEWCGHCLRLLKSGGEWESALTSLSKKINVIEIEHSILPNFNKVQVTYFPCIRIYKSGEEIAEFTEDPTSENINMFVDKYVSSQKGGKRTSRSVSQKRKNRRRRLSKRRNQRKN